jgi:hypothetical protein
MKKTIKQREFLITNEKDFKKRERPTKFLYLKTKE